MVPDSGKTPGIDSIKPVNLPEPLEVKEDPSGLPIAVKIRRWQIILAIDDKWRIDEEWWRDEAVSRLYFAVRLNSGQHLVLFKDLIGGHWYKQTY